MINLTVTVFKGTFFISYTKNNGSIRKMEQNYNLGVEIHKENNRKEYYSITGIIDNETYTIDVYNYTKSEYKKTSNVLKKFYKERQQQYTQVGKALYKYLVETGIWEKVESKELYLIPVSPVPSHILNKNTGEYELKYAKQFIKREALVDDVNNNKIPSGDDLYYKIHVPTTRLTKGDGGWINGKYEKNVKDKKKKDGEKITLFEANQYTYTPEEIKGLMLDGGVTLFAMNVLKSSNIAFVDNDNDEYDDLITVFDKYSVWTERKINPDMTNKSGKIQYNTHGHSIIRVDDNVPKLTGGSNKYIRDIKTVSGEDSKFEVFYNTSKGLLVGIGFYMDTKDGKERLYNYQIQGELNNNVPVIKDIDELRSIILKNDVLKENREEYEKDTKQKTNTPINSEKSKNVQTENIDINDNILHDILNNFKKLYYEEHHNHNNISYYISGGLYASNISYDNAEQFISYIYDSSNDGDPLMSRIANLKRAYSGEPTGGWGSVVNNVHYNRQEWINTINEFTQYLDKENKIYGSLKDYITHILKPLLDEKFLEKSLLILQYVMYIIQCTVLKYEDTTMYMENIYNMYCEKYEKKNKTLCIEYIKNCNKREHIDIYYDYTYKVKGLINTLKQKKGLNDKQLFYLEKIESFICEDMSRLVRRDNLMRKLLAGTGEKVLKELNSYLMLKYNLRRCEEKYYIYHDDMYKLVDKKNKNYDILNNVLNDLTDKHGFKTRFGMQEIKLNDYQKNHLLEYTNQSIRVYNNYIQFQNGIYNTKECKLIDNKMCVAGKRAGYEENNNFNYLTYYDSINFDWLMDYENRDHIGTALIMLINTFIPPSALSDARDISTLSEDNFYLQRFKQVLQFLGCNARQENPFKKFLLLRGDGDNGKTAVATIFNEVMEGVAVTEPNKISGKSLGEYAYKDNNMLMLDDPEPEQIESIKPIIKSDTGEGRHTERIMHTDQTKQYKTSLYWITSNKHSEKMLEDEQFLSRCYIMELETQFKEDENVPEYRPPVRGMSEKLRNDKEGLNNFISLILNVYDETREDLILPQTRLDKERIILKQEDEITRLLKTNYANTGEIKDHDVDGITNKEILDDIIYYYKTQGKIIKSQKEMNEISKKIGYVLKEDANVKKYKIEKDANTSKERNGVIYPKIRINPHRKVFVKGKADNIIRDCENSENIKQIHEILSFVEKHEDYNDLIDYTVNNDKLNEARKQLIAGDYLVQHYLLRL